MTDRTMNRTLAKCPRCKNLVKPIRKSNRQSMWQKAFVPFAGYYGAFVWSCPICDFRLPKDESNDRNHEIEWMDESTFKG
jgi:uncharacterized C2H2 Zn-finger protein